MGLTQTVAPTIEPVSLVEAKRHLRVEADEENADITEMIAAARRSCEKWTDRQFVTATWRLTLGGFPNAGDTLSVPLPLLQSVTSIQYIDPDGVTQTWNVAKYDVDTDSKPGRIVPAFGESWPTTRSDIDSVTIVFVAGYGAETAVPFKVRQAIKLLVGHWFANRESVLVGPRATTAPQAVEALLDTERMVSVA